MLTTKFNMKILIFAGIVAVISGENIFQSILQRRSKPIRWKWNNDLMKSADVQRPSFLPKETAVKWWKEMAPKRDARTSSIVTKDSFDSTDRTYFKRRTHFSTFKRPRLTETSKRENKSNFLFNNTQPFREDNFRQSRQSPFDNLLPLPSPNQPFEKDNKVFTIEHALAPTEKTYIGENFPSVFDSLQDIPQQNETDDFNGKKNEHSTSSYSSDHEIDSEFLREAIIQERHKPSKFEIQSASQRLKDSSRNARNLGSAQQLKSSVEYIVPTVEHVLSHVEYADNISESLESQIPSILSSVEYVSPTVEFVKPEVEYLPENNATTESMSLFELENSLTDQDIAVIEEESFANERKSPLERYENEGIRTDIEGARFQIVGLRREQINLRRNRGRNQLGVPEEDYPTLEALPVVQFHCGDYLPGYYVDITTRCQVFHICHENGRRSSFLCPVGTVFNQEYLVCDWWYNVDCVGSSKYYSSDTLQGYSSNSKNNRIYSKLESPKEKTFDANRETLSHSSVQDIKQNKKHVNNNSKQTKDSNLPHKAVNYPVGYAVLLREYMKNSFAGDTKENGYNSYNSLEKNNTENLKHQKSKQEIEENKKASLSDLTLGDKEENNRDFQNRQPTGNHEDDVFESYKYQPIYFGGSKPYNPTTTPTYDYNDRLSGSFQTISYKSYIREFLDASKALEYEYDDDVRNVLPVSFQKEALPLDKNTDITTERPRNTFENQKNIENKNFDKNKFYSSKTKSKPLNRKSENINNYRFIIDPTEAIKPASKQYVTLEKHLNNTNGAIKFRHAESTIKHIKPRTKDRLTFTTAVRTGKISKRNSEESYDRLDFKRANSFKSNIPPNSDFPTTVKPKQRVKYRYGERLVKPSLFPKYKSNYDIFNASKQSGNKNLTHKEHNLSITKKPDFYSIYQIKNNTKDNNTFDLVPLESQRKFNFTKAAPNLFLNAYKAQKEKPEIETNTFSIKKHESEKENKYMSGKKKITIRVRMERNDVLLKDINNKNTLINKNISSRVANSSDQHGNSSLVTLNSLQYGEMIKNASHSNKTNNTEQQSTKQSTSFKEDMKDLKSLNLTKISNTYGGYAIVKVAAIVQNKNMTLFEDKKNLTMPSIHQELETNRTSFVNSSAV